MDDFYVYVYLDPRKPGSYIYGSYSFEFEPIYVGKGRNRRASQHLCEWNLENDWNKLKTNKFKKIKKETGNFPEAIIISSDLEENEAYDLETKVIGTIGRIDLETGPLTNLTDGGKGMSGKKYSDETKLKMRMARLGKKRGPHSEEHTRKIAESNRGQKRSEETRRKISEVQKGRKISEEIKKKMSERGLQNKELHREKNIEWWESHPEERAARSIKYTTSKYLIFTKDGRFISEESNLREFCERNNLNIGSIRSSIFNNETYKGLSIKRVPKDFVIDLKVDATIQEWVEIRKLNKIKKIRIPKPRAPKKPKKEIHNHEISERNKKWWNEERKSERSKRNTGVGNSNAKYKYLVYKNNELIEEVENLRLFCEKNNFPHGYIRQCVRKDGKYKDLMIQRVSIKGAN